VVRGPPSTRRGNLAEDFGFTDKPENDNGSSLAPALMFNHQPQLYHDVRPGLDVLIGGESLDSASAGLAAMQGEGPHAGQARPGADSRAACPRVRHGPNRLPSGLTRAKLVRDARGDGVA